jgi:hypothetical protein
MEARAALSFMPSPGSVVRLTSGEIGTVVKVTPKGDDDRVMVLRESEGKWKAKEVRINIDLIEKILYEI